MGKNGSKGEPISGGGIGRFWDHFKGRVLLFNEADRRRIELKQKGGGEN